MVIGTGQNGTCTLAEAHRSKLPTMTAAIRKGQRVASSVAREGEGASVEKETMFLLSG